MRSLDPLPFEDGEFDFVGIKGIAMGVPEDEVSIRPFAAFQSVIDFVRSGHHSSRFVSLVFLFFVEC